MDKNKLHINRFLLILLVIHLLLSSTIVLSQTNTKGVKAITSNQSSYTKTKAIIVGISNYMNIRSLNYAHSDALNFYNFLVSDAGGRVDSNNIVLLLNDDATSANIYASLDWLVDEAKEGERIIIYFSGHGDLETKTIRQNGFLLGYDAPEHCYMAGGTVSVGFLQDYMETIALQCKSNILLITDACRSGKLAGGQEGAQNTSAALAQNWQSITKVLSSQAGEYSLEADSWGNGAGVFTYYLVNGLTGKADRNNNDEVSTQELYMYLLENIGRETNYAQNPILVGDMTSTLAWVDSLSLAQLDVNTQIGSHELLASKGFESMYKEQLSTEAYANYERFRYCLENELLVPEYSDNENAWDIYQSIIEDENAEIIHKHIKRSLLAALQNESQIIVNSILTNQDNEIDFDTDRARTELHYTFNLINTSYILYNDIRARYLFLKSVDMETAEDQVVLLEEASEIKPDAAYLYNRLGVQYYNLEQFELAIKTFNKAINLVPTWSYPYYNLGGAYYAKKQYDEAIEFYYKSISLNPKEANGYANLGLTYMTLTQYNKANEFFYKALELRPDEAAVYNNLGINYIMLKQHNKAIESFQKYIELKPDDAAVYYKLGIVYNELKQYDKAIEHYQKTIKLNPNDAFAYFFLGETYYVQKNYSDAIKAYQKSIELNSVYLKTYKKLADSYRKAEQYESALNYYTIVLENDSTYEDCYVGLGYTYLQLGNYELALASFEKTIELSPEKPKNYYNITCFYALQNNTDKALEWMEKSLKKGYDSWEHIATDSDIDSIRDTEKYKELINKYKKDN